MVWTFVRGMFVSSVEKKYNQFQTDLKIVSDETCRYNTTYDPSTLRDFELCAGKMEGGANRCMGSGQNLMQT